MKKLLLVLMFIVSMVSFSNKVVVSMGYDNVRDDAHPTTWVILNNQRLLTHHMVDYLVLKLEMR